MSKTVQHIKNVIISVSIIMLGILCAMKLMQIQVVNDDEIVNNPISLQYPNSSVYTKTINSSRGNIIDYFDRAIVQNKITYKVILDGNIFPNDTQIGNQVLIDLYYSITSKNHPIEFSLPVSKTEPYVFKGDEDAQLNLKQNIKLNVYATADNCIDKLIDDYQISDEFSQEEKWIISAFRYELIIKDFSGFNNFIVAEDVSEEIILDVKANNIILRGADIVADYEREITIGNVIPHEIGTIGPIYAEEYEELKEKGYALDDVVGKSGIEYVMESTLRGQDGVEEITINNDSIVNSKITTPLVAGNDVKLTVDSRYQQQLQDILVNFINNFGSLNSELKPKCGSIVVLDAKTGAVKGLATAPTYDLNTYLQDYESVLNAENTPLVNRATDGSYRPGSTFKTITATAGLNEGIVNGDTCFNCQHTYDFLDITVNCTGYHNEIGVSRAITVSCNIYFYELARLLTLDGIVKYEELYGLGSPTGLETGDASGYLATPETFEDLGLDWYVGEVLQAAIGQSAVSVTPLQMAVVANTIANDGVRYQPYLIDGIYDHTTGNCINKTKPTIAETIPVNYADTFDYITSGMIGASENMPSQYSLSNLGYSVAIKTGTPQQDSRVQDSFFIGFAPADNPVVAFAGVIEGGDYSKYMIRDILQAYDECYGILDKKDAKPLETTTTSANGESTTETTTTTTNITQ